MFHLSKYPFRMIYTHTNYWDRCMTVGDFGTLITQYPIYPNLYYAQDACLMPFNYYNDYLNPIHDIKKSGNVFWL